VALPAGQYMALPPDVNAARILGPGPGSMLAAHAAAHGLGVALHAAAANVSSAVATLNSVGWTGPSGISTAASFAPHVAVMHENAAISQAMALKILAQAEAYQAAYLAIPPLAAVTENQTEHMTLQATNIMGINAMPIAINRGVYSGMWTDAGTAMNTYDALGSAASTPLPATPPPPITAGMAVGLATTGASMGLQIGTGVMQGAMNAAETGLSTFSGVASGAASTAPAVAQAMGSNTGTTAGGTGQPANPAMAAKAGDPAQQLTPLLAQGAQAAGQIPQALGSAPSALTSAGEGPVQAIMGPLQGMMTGGSGLGGTPASAGGLNGLSGLSGMYPGGLPASGAESGGRSASKSVGLMRSAGIGGGSGYSMPSGWRTTSDTLGIGARPASGVGSGSPVAGGADLRSGAGGAGMGPMLGPAGTGAGRGRGTRSSSALSWEEDPFGADEDDDLPMVLTTPGERGT
jgi:PPE-repeat protein